MDYSVMIDEKNFFDQPLKSDMKTYDNIRKMVAYQRDNYSSGCFLDYNLFKEHKMITIDLSKSNTINSFY